MIDIFNFYKTGETEPTIIFNEEDILGPYPFDVFEVEVDERQDTGRSKMQQHGIWRVRPFRNFMTIHIEGGLLGDDAETYVARRRALVDAIQHDPNVDPMSIARIHGTIHMLPSGESEEWLADVITSMFDAPTHANEGDWSTTRYAISWYSDLPYFVGADSGLFYYWS